MPSSALLRSPARVALIRAAFYARQSASLAESAQTESELETAILAESIARDESAQAHWLASHHPATCTALVLIAA